MLTVPIFAEIDGQMIFLFIVVGISFLRWVAGTIKARIVEAQLRKQAEQELLRPPKKAAPPSPPRATQAPERAARPTPPREAPAQTRSPLEELQEFLGEMAEPETEPEAEAPRTRSQERSVGEPRKQPPVSRTTPPPAPRTAQSPPPLPASAQGAGRSVKVTSSGAPAVDQVARVAKAAIGVKAGDNYQRVAQERDRRHAEEVLRQERLREMLSSPEGLRTAWIVSEVLGKPKGLDL